MTIEEAIKRAEETAIGEDELCKRYDRASGYSRNHDETIRTTDAKRCEKIAQEHRQLAEWLKDYKRLLENSSEIPTGTPNTISFKEMTDNLKITADDIENAEDLEYSIEPLVHPKNDLGVDCISRFSAKQIIRNHYCSIPSKAFKKLIEELDSLSPVTPQPRKGHWIETAEEYYKAVNEKGGGVNEDTDYFTDDIACSECLAKFSVIDNEAERFDFCPKCGVKMVEPQESEDKE